MDGQNKLSQVERNAELAAHLEPQDRLTGLLILNGHLNCKELAKLHRELNLWPVDWKVEDGQK